MDRGIYAATSAGLSQLKRIEVVNNNLANINTAGFKRQFLVTQAESFDQTIASTMSKQDPYARGDHDRVMPVVSTETRTDFAAGPVKYTGNPLDVALRNPNDFFVISTNQGLQYTRAGDFTINTNGELVTQDGFPVQGEGGSIATSGSSVSINADGSVRAGGQTAGRLAVTRVDNPEKLERAGNSRFKLPQGGANAGVDVDPELVTSSLEMSNESAISSVVEMMTTQRAFQAYTKTIESVDTLNQAAINQIGRAR